MIDSKEKQIKTLLGVFGGGISAGILIALFMLYYYDPTGAYTAKNILLTPENAYSLHFTETGSKSKPEGKYAFSGVYFSFFDPESKQMKTVSVPREQYDLFYHLVANDKSIVKPGDAIFHLFQGQSASLALKVRTVGEDTSKGIEIPFLEIVFASGDHYRVQLRQAGPAQEWAYFYHPGIYEDALHLFRSSL